MSKTLILLEKNPHHKGYTGLELLTQAIQHVFIKCLLCVKICARHWHIVNKT